jgi:hypothetical protein
MQLEFGILHAVAPWHGLGDDCTSTNTVSTWRQTRETASCIFVFWYQYHDTAVLLHLFHDRVIYPLLSPWLHSKYQTDDSGRYAQSIMCSLPCNISATTRVIGSKKNSKTSKTKTRKHLWPVGKIQRIYHKFLLKCLRNYYFFDLREGVH